MAGQASEKLLSKLTEFLVCEIADKALDGITYVMVTKTPKDKELYDKYLSIKKEVINCGYSNDEVFRIYEVSNGYIFDMDLTVAKTITDRLADAIAKTDGVKVPPDGLIGDKPSKRRKSDMLALAKYVKQQYDNGIRDIEVALFSRNNVPRVVITGTGPKGEPLAVKYNAYALRHWDIETINANILIPTGIRISSIAPCEILPSKTGVRFVLHTEAVKL